MYRFSETFGIVCGFLSTLGLFYLFYPFRPPDTMCMVAGIAFSVALYIGGGWRFIRVMILTSPRDLKALFRLIKAKYFIYRMKRRNATVPEIFVENAKKHPNRIAFHYQDQAWTFAELDEFSNRVANHFMDEGFRPNDEVALFLDSKPEYVGLWLGLAKIGVITALINTSQRLKPLLHSITVVNCKAVIYGSELTEAVGDIVGLLKEKRKITYYCWGKPLIENVVPAQLLTELLPLRSTEQPKIAHKANFTDRLFYIYTSGTTGLPKAAIIRHSRYFWMGTSLRRLINFHNNETIYTCIPLYHLAGGCLGTCQVLVYGDTMAIRQRFSASNFWDDCIRYKCTAAQYIGEMCRYLLCQPEKTQERAHKVRLMFGNGLRPKIWDQFTNRFNIRQLGEFYGSTEGNANIINLDNQPGACGFITQVAPILYPVALIRVDELTGEVIRTKDGMCQICGPGECGEFVGKINKNDPSRAFDGYINEDATTKKVVENVFRMGDSAYLSGDILYMDGLGYVYFRDRTGDTFRWKGENVSTTEVEAVISNALKLVDSVVYGVEVGDCEGKAGMAAIVDPQMSINFPGFLQILRLHLPTYALPVFVRQLSKLEATSTYKLPKFKLQKEGFNPAIVQDDPLYFLDAKLGIYSRITGDIYKRLISGQIKI